MDEPITARYEWNADGYVNALQAHKNQLRTWTDRLILAIIPSLIALSYFVMTVVVLRSPGRWAAKGAFVGGMSAVLGSLLAVLYFTFGTQTLSRRSAQNAFRHLPPEALRVEWSFNEAELSNRTALSASTFLWPLFIKAVEAPGGFLLYQNTNYFHWVPVHGFASEAEMKRFADLVRSRVANYVMIGESRFPTKPEPLGFAEL